MKPYYQDDLVTLYHGRCEDVLPTLSLTGSVHLLTDPPYFKVKDNDWDNQWSKSAEFLDWMGDWLDLAKPHLSPDASVWVFASPELTSAVESVVASRFRVLNSVRWVKASSPVEKGWKTARSFLSLWEGIVFAEQRTHVGEYMKTEWERAGWKAGALGKALRFDSALPKRWSDSPEVYGASRPSPVAYESLRQLLGAGYMEAAYTDMVRSFQPRSRGTTSYVFTFDTVAPYPGKHVCEKPAELLAHMIETTTRPGDTIIDCFAGSGAVLDVARQLGRKAVGIEMDAHWCRQISKRLSQQAFDLGEIA